MRVTAKMLNGDIHTADVIIADRVAYSTTARRHGWPTRPDEDPILFGYYTAFSALRRTGSISTGWDDFINNCDDIDVEGDDEDPTATENGAD